MASIKKKSSGGGGANWMDTYGDMVTLLLCFFVLLYSMSTIDTKKWEWIVQQFNPNSIDMEEPGPVDSGSASKGGDELPTTQVDEAMDELYQFLKSYAQTRPSPSAKATATSSSPLTTPFSSTATAPRYAPRARPFWTP